MFKKVLSRVGLIALATFASSSIIPSASAHHIVNPDAKGGCVGDSVVFTPEVVTFVYPAGDENEKPTAGGFEPNGYMITRDYGGILQHTGVDLAKEGNAGGGVVRAIGPGRVVRIREQTTIWGHMVRIEHRLANGSRVYSQYAHLEEKSITLNCDDVVLKGEEIGKVGKTGAERVHLHFEIKGINEDGCGYIYSGPESLGSACKDTPSNNFNRYTDPLEFIEIYADPPEPRFDFAVNYLSIDGNIFGSGDPDDTDDFLDNFNDGSVTQYPTSELHCFGPVSTESGGSLRLTTSDGANNFSAPFLVDNCHLGLSTGTTRLNDGDGDAIITVGFLADFPAFGQQYGIQLVTTNSNELVNIQIGNNGNGNAIITALAMSASGTRVTSNNEILDLDGAQHIIFRLRLDDSLDRVVPEYATNPSGPFIQTNLPLSSATIFSSGSQAHVSVFGSVNTDTFGGP